MVSTIVTTINDGKELKGFPPYTIGQLITDVKYRNARTKIIAIKPKK